jgi:hypothetical protein
MPETVSAQSLWPLSDRSTTKGSGASVRCSRTGPVRPPWGHHWRRYLCTPYPYSVTFFSSLSPIVFCDRDILCLRKDLGHGLLPCLHPSFDLLGPHGRGGRVPSLSSVQYARHLSSPGAFQRSSSLPKSRILTIITFAESGGHALFAPYFMACPFWILFKIVISFCKIPINRLLALFNRPVITVVNDCTSHTTKNRFNDILPLLFWYWGTVFISPEATRDFPPWSFTANSPNSSIEKNFSCGPRWERIYVILSSLL